MDNSFFTIMAVLGVFMILFVFIIIAAYILLSLGLYSLLKNNKYKNSKLCWLPFVNIYSLGLLVSDKSRFPKIELFLLFGSIIAILIPILGFISVIGSYWFWLFLLTCLLTYSLLIYSLNLLYSRYSSESRVLYTMLSVAFILIAPAFIYSIKDNDPEDIEIEASAEESIDNLESTDKDVKDEIFIEPIESVDLAHLVKEELEAKKQASAKSLNESQGVIQTTSQQMK
ncbi:MAG: hypothetical protein AB6733_07805 [Clostridiaceae bacterium]